MGWGGEGIWRAVQPLLARSFNKVTLNCTETINFPEQLSQELCDNVPFNLRCNCAWECRLLFWQFPRAIVYVAQKAYTSFWCTFQVRKIAAYNEHIKKSKWALICALFALSFPLSFLLFRSISFSYLSLFLWSCLIVYLSVRLCVRLFMDLLVHLWNWLFLLHFLAVCDFINFLVYLSVIYLSIHSFTYIRKRTKWIIELRETMIEMWKGEKQ